MARVVYSEEFRIESVKQVTKNGYSINDTAKLDKKIRIPRGYKKYYFKSIIVL